MKRQKKGKGKKKKDGSITTAAKKIIGKSKSTLNKTKKARAATSSRKGNRNSKSSAVAKRLTQTGKSVGKAVAKKGAAKKKKKKKAKNKRKSDNDTTGGGGFFLAADDNDDDDNPFLQQEMLTPEELEMRKAAEEQREMIERFKMATEDLLISERALSKEVVEENTPHERLAVGCQVMARYGGKEKVISEQGTLLLTEVSNLMQHATTLTRDHVCHLIGVKSRDTMFSSCSSGFRDTLRR